MAMERYAANVWQGAGPRTSFTEDQGIGRQDYRLTARYEGVLADGGVCRPLRRRAAILRWVISGDAVYEICRHIVIPADRVVLEYGSDVAAPGEARDLAGEPGGLGWQLSGCERLVIPNLPDSLDAGFYCTVTSMNCREVA
jgi:hypothetical protein